MKKENKPKKNIVNELLINLRMIDIQQNLDTQIQELKQCIDKILPKGKMKDFSIESGIQLLSIQRNPKARYEVFLMYLYFIEKIYMKLYNSFKIHQDNKTEFYLKLKETRNASRISPSDWFICYFTMTEAVRSLIFDCDYIDLFWNEYWHYCEKKVLKKEKKEIEKLRIEVNNINWGKYIREILDKNLTPSVKVWSGKVYEFGTMVKRKYEENKDKYNSFQSALVEMCPQYIQINGKPMSPASVRESLRQIGITIS
jgi:hypothetical protein